MKIRRIDISGFKSFREKTILLFDKDITAVVGPNGCGKSNIVDAIRWCLGEQSPKNLRGKMMEDVIFAGSEQYPPQPAAEVNLFVSTNGYDLPQKYREFTELTVTRKLYRNGDSGYYINNTPVRLMDITELFLGTGIGTKAYSIIEQGRIGAIVSARPEDRRGYIEEAAGISLYRSRRRIAERKLERTSQNLIRLNDIIEEVKRNLNSLHRQAKKAERFNRLKEELRGLELSRARGEFDEITKEIESLRARILEEKTAMTALSAGAEAEENEIESERLMLVDEERELNAAFEALTRLNDEIALAEKEIAIFKEREEAVVENIRETAKERERTSEAKTELWSKLQVERTKLENIVEDSETADRINQLENVIAEAKEAIESLNSELEGSRAAQLDFATQITHYSAQLDSIEKRIKELESLSARHKEELEEMAVEEKGLALKIADTKQSQQKLSQLKLDLTTESKKKTERLSEISERWEKTALLLEEKKSQLADLRSRRQSLVEIQKSYEGFAEGVKGILNWSGEGSFYTLLAQAVEPEKEFETALQAALGDRLQYIVAASQEEGIAALDYLKRENKGRAAIMPLKPRNSSAQSDVAPEKWKVTPLAAVVKVKESFEEIGALLFDNIWVVDTLATAKEIFNSYPGLKATLVTMEGEVMEPSGVITGGSPEALETGFLARNREIKELSQTIEELSGEIAVIQEKYEEDKKFLSDLKKGLDNLKQNAHQEEIKIISLDKDVKRYEENLASLRERRDMIKSDLSRAKTQINEFHSETEQVKRRLGELERRNRMAQEEELALKEKWGELNKKLNAYTEERSRLTIKISTVEERKKSASNLVESIEGQIERAEKRLDELALRNEQLEGQLEELKTARAEKESNRRERVAEYQGEKVALDARRADYEKRVNETSAREVELKRRQKDVAQKREIIGELALKEQEKDLNRKHLIEDYENRYGVNLAKLPAEETPFGDQQLERLDWLRAKIQELGMVNPAAIEEFEELSKRYEFLTEQREDLVQSVEKLKKAISKINRASRKRFMEAFEAINERFSTLFPRLFNGGKAGLRLSDEHDPLEAGVEIIAQPPGEKLKHIELLSGGQKALTAVAFIFAIFLYKPSPFCVLDEIDAPLDEANIGRVNRLIKELSTQSQFIIITHNKQTMALAQELYGVTTEEAGVSKIVGVKLEEVAKTQEVAAAVQRENAELRS
ncbi:MAG: chromosome segregation protein SMC [Myxococcota bacterium]